jgi:hypothetical protein
MENRHIERRWDGFAGEQRKFDFIKNGERGRKVILSSSPLIWLCKEWGCSREAPVQFAAMAVSTGFGEAGGCGLEYKVMG